MRLMIDQGEPASTIPVEYRPHGQSFMDSPPGIATGLMCLTPGQREVGSPVVRLEGGLTEQYKRGCQKSTEMEWREIFREQGEPASATRNTGHTDNPFVADSPPGIAIQFRTSSAGYPMVRLDDTSKRTYLKGGRRFRGLSTIISRNRM